MGYIILQEANNYKYLVLMYNMSMSENPISHETIQDLLELSFLDVKRGDVIKV